MHFCPVCGRVMVRDTSSGYMVFRCTCGVEEKGSAEDARVAGTILGAGETTEMYRRVIQTAPYDRSNQRVRRNCPNCGLDYMVQIRVGDAEIIVYRCKCGYETKGGAGPVAAE